MFWVAGRGIREGDQATVGHLWLSIRSIKLITVITRKSHMLDCMGVWCGRWMAAAAAAAASRVEEIEGCHAV